MKRNLLSLLSASLALWLMLRTAILPAFADGEGEDPSEPTISHASAAYLYNFENNQVLYTYNAGEKVYPSSTVKLMTAIVAMEHFEGALDTPVTVTEEMLELATGNLAELTDGEEVTVEQLLNCMLVASANDAAIALAYAVAGDVPSFVAQMNGKAAALGANSTVYTNPTGMFDYEMVTTAEDTALIARYAYTIPGLVEMTSTSKYVMDATNRSDFRNLYNRNAMISKYYSTAYYDSRAVGLNAGGTSQGGYSICAVAEDPETELTYLAVVLGADFGTTEAYHYSNAAALLNWAFDTYAYREILSTRKTVCEIPVNLSSTIDYVTLVPKESLYLYLPSTADLSSSLHYSYSTYTETLDAPVEAGTEAGIITVFLGEQVLGSCPLITTSSVTRSEFLHFLDEVQEFTEGRFFRGMLISAVVLSILYVFLRARQREKKLRRMSGRR